MLSKIISIIIAVFALWLFFKIFAVPLGWLLRLLLNALAGLVILFAVNFVGSYIGLHISVGWISALITGVLGLPGVVLLLLIENLII